MDKLVEKGVVFPFIKRFLNINNEYSKEKPVEVVLMSRNSPETGLRIFNSIQYYKLDITRALFTSGSSPFKYIPTYNISLFLSTNENDVQSAIKLGFGAGRVLKTNNIQDDDELELRVAFDFDGVIIDDQAEKVYRSEEGLEGFQVYEKERAFLPHSPGPLADFFKKLSIFQKLETQKQRKNIFYKKLLKTSIITARNAPSHARLINTLEKWGIVVDELFFLGGIEKSRVLEILMPHIFFDDQMTHLGNKNIKIPLVHVPFGISNFPLS